LKYERKIIPSYNETLRACFTVVKSKLFEFFEFFAFFLKLSKEKEHMEFESIHSMINNIIIFSGY